jgi:hypothetical protein
VCVCVFVCVCLCVCVCVCVYFAFTTDYVQFLKVKLVSLIENLLPLLMSLGEKGSIQP